MIGIYLALEKAGAKNLVERTRKAARAAGIAFGDHEAATWLAPFVAKHRAQRPETVAKRENNLTLARKRARDSHGNAHGNAHGKLRENRTEPSTEPGTNSARNRALTRDKGISSIDLSSTDSLRSSALAFGDWPRENDGLRKLAKYFMAAFGNIRNAETAKKHYPAYLETLSIFRSRSVPLVVAWQACTDCLEAYSFVPLFGAKIKKAIAFLPARENSKVTPLRRPDPTQGVPLG